MLGPPVRQLGRTQLDGQPEMVRTRLVVARLVRTRRVLARLARPRLVLARLARSMLARLSRRARRLGGAGELVQLGGAGELGLLARTRVVLAGWPTLELAGQLERGQTRLGKQLGLVRARSALELARQLGSRSRPILELAGSEPAKPELAGPALERVRQLGARWAKQP